MTDYADALDLMDFTVADDGDGNTVLLTSTSEEFHVAISNGHGEAPATLDTPCLVFEIEGADWRAADGWSEPVAWDTLREALANGTL